MNRSLAFLVFCGLLFWSVFAYRLLEKTPKSILDAEETAVADISIDNLFQWMKPQEKPSEKLRDPFLLPEIFRPSFKVKQTILINEKKSEPVVIIPKPQITLDAILPGERPVAILRHKGTTAVVRVGQEIWSVKIEKITPESVTLHYAGEFFELKK